MIKIEIKTRFNSSDFQEEITEKLKENGFIEYREGEQTPMGFRVGGFEVKKPFTINIEG